MKRKIPFLTSSITNQYVGCKYSYWKSFIETNGYETYRDDNIDEPEYLIFGTLMHGVIEQFWKSPLTRTKKFLIDTYENDLVDSGLTDKEYIQLGYEIIDNFFNYLLHEAPPRKALHSELGFSVTIGGVPLHGHIDQIFYHGDGIYEIEDYKTSKWIKSQDEVDEDIQLSMYDLVFSNECMKEYWFKGIKPKGIILSLHYLRSGTVVKSERTEYSRVNALAYFRTIYKQMQKLDDSKFTPTLNNLCTFCGHCDECEAYQSVIADEYEEFNIEDFDSKAEYDLAMYLDLRARIKILENESNYYYNEIYEYLDNHGAEPISYNGYDYYLSQGGRRYVKTNVAKKILEENGLWDPMYFINSLPLGKLDNLVKDYPDVQDRISTFAIGFNYSKPSLTSKKSTKLFKTSKRRK